MKSRITGYNDQDVDVDPAPPYRSNGFGKYRINTGGHSCDGEPTKRWVHKL